jgi:hypothetical protein
MSLSENERIDLKSGMVIMEQGIAALSRAQETSAAASTELAKGINELVTEMRERDIKDEYFRAKITKVEENQGKYIKDFGPVMERVIKSHDKWDKFTSGMATNWGRLASVAIIVMIAMALGLDVSKIFKL